MLGEEIERLAQFGSEKELRAAIEEELKLNADSFLRDVNNLCKNVHRPFVLNIVEMTLETGVGYRPGLRPEALLKNARILRENIERRFREGCKK